MIRGSTVRILSAAVCTVLLGFETGFQSGCAEAVSHNVHAVAMQRSTPAVVRVGMWTLWHDREIAVVPVGSATLRTCTRCAGHPLKHGLVLHAVGNSVEGATSIPQAMVWIDGTLTLRAHGESDTLHYPLTISARNGELILAVTLPVETYVERVNASESGPNDTLESLKALAIVVRTYALHVPHGHPDYNLCDSTHCQLLHWHGIPNRTAAAHAATLATAGETLWFHNRPALAYFNKDCGGFTAAPNQIWPNARAIDYLPARPDPYCARRGGNDWATELSRQDIASALAMRGLAPRGWQSLSVGRRAASGRALTIRLDAREIPAEEFRLVIGAALGWNRIPSTWFEVSEQGQNFYFHGRGWGHGVGLCQKGAAAMAAEGHRTSEILSQYFPGAEAVDDATDRAWITSSGAGFMLETLDSSAIRYLPELARVRVLASQRSGLNPTAMVTVRDFPSTSAFRNATLAPGWVAAFTEGDFIATQPLAILSARHLLEPTLLHEFLHALVEQQCYAAVPLWLREGLVELWSLPPESADALRTRQATVPVSSIDSVLAHGHSEAQSAAAHQAAAIFAAHLLNRYGREQVVAWLRSGIPASVLASAR